MAACRVLYCHCAYSRVIPSPVKEEVLRGLVDSGVAFEAVPDLCEMSARRDPALRRLASGDDEIKIAACYPRAVKWLFAAAGAPLPDSGVVVRNMRQESAEEVLRAVLGSSEAATATRQGADAGSRDGQSVEDDAATNEETEDEPRSAATGRSDT